MRAPACERQIPGGCRDLASFRVRLRRLDEKGRPCGEREIFYCATHARDLQRLQRSHPAALAKTRPSIEALS
jgi:hypothetical protein